MKHLLFIAVLLSSSLLFAQSELKSDIAADENYQLKDMGITVTVDSEKEIEQSIKYDDIRSFAKLAERNQDIVLKLDCYNRSTSKNIKTHVSYKVEGNTNDIEGFIALVEKVKKSASNYYKNSSKS